jgi:hypothetical protein
MEMQQFSTALEAEYPKRLFEADATILPRLGPKQGVTDHSIPQSKRQNAPSEAARWTICTTSGARITQGISMLLTDKPNMDSRTSF